MRPIARYSLFALLTPVLAGLTGCGYVHFGRLDRPTATAQPELVAENTDLRAEKKLLEQELVLARKESDALRAALDSRKNGDESELAAKLRDTTRELAGLRADYARLQSERSQARNFTGTVGADEQIADLRSRLGTAETRLAQAENTRAAAEQANARLRTELDDLRRENTSLAGQLQSLLVQNEQAAAEGRPFGAPERAKARVDAMVETLFTTFEPRP